MDTSDWAELQYSIYVFCIVNEEATELEEVGAIWAGNTCQYARRCEDEDEKCIEDYGHRHVTIPVEKLIPWNDLIKQVKIPVFVDGNEHISEVLK